MGVSTTPFEDNRDNNGLFFVLLWLHFGCTIRMIFYVSSLFIVIFSINTFAVGMVNLRSYLSISNTGRPVDNNQHITYLL